MRCLSSTFFGTAPNRLMASAILTCSWPYMLGAMLATILLPMFGSAASSSISLRSASLRFDALDASSLLRMWFARTCVWKTGKPDRFVRW